MILENVLDLIWGDGQKGRAAFQQFIEGNANIHKLPSFLQKTGRSREAEVTFKSALTH